MKKYYIASTLLLTLILLNGCTAILVGGAGVGGYVVGTDERKIGDIAEDASITARVKATLIKDSQIDAFDINVDTYRRVVTLHGHVKSSSQVTRAVSLARTVSGVRKVVSKLSIIK